MPILEGTEREYVISKLTKLVQATGRTWFVANLQDDETVDQSYLADLPYHPVPRDLAVSAVNMSLADDGKKYRGSFAGIVKGIDPSLDPKLGEILKKFDTYQAGPAVCAADPYVSHFLAHGLPFWDRAALRGKLKQIKAGRSILLVNGPPKSGRSYTLQLLKHLELSGVPIKVAPVLPPIDSSNKTEMTPSLLAESILYAMELKPQTDKQPGEGGQTKNQYHTRLAQWVLDHVPDDQTAFWIVVDGVGLDGVDPGCRGFLTRLAWKISGRQVMRLVLIDFPADDLDALSDVLEIDTACSTPSDDDLRSAIKEALDNYHIAYRRDDLDHFLELIKAAVTIARGDPAYWRQLNQRMREKLNA